MRAVASTAAGSSTIFHPVSQRADALRQQVEARAEQGDAARPGQGVDPQVGHEPQVVPGRQEQAESSLQKPP